MTTFVQIHTLRDYGPSLPNRGADGLAKRCHYGDAERQRISSQCIKAALREPTLGLAELAAELGLDMSVRSGAAISRVLGPDLESRGMSEEDAKAYAKGVASAFVKEGGAVEDDGKLSQPIVVGGTELRLLADIAEALQSKEIGADEVRNVLAKPSSARKAGVEDIIASMHATNANAGIDGALFGRFATGVALHTVDGCVDVAHALTTHQIQSVANFFSAQDQLLEEDEAGAAHIGTVELTTALYYNYAVVNVDQLSKNIASLDVNQRVDCLDRPSLRHRGASRQARQHGALQRADRPRGGSGQTPTGQLCRRLPASYPSVRRRGYCRSIEDKADGSHDPPGRDLRRSRSEVLLG